MLRLRLTPGAGAGELKIKQMKKISYEMQIKELTLALDCSRKWQDHWMFKSHALELAPAVAQHDYDLAVNWAVSGYSHHGGVAMSKTVKVDCLAVRIGSSLDCVWCGRCDAELALHDDTPTRQELELEDAMDRAVIEEDEE